MTDRHDSAAHPEGCIKVGDKITFLKPYHRRHYRSIVAQITGIHPEAGRGYLVAAELTSRGPSQNARRWHLLSLANLANVRVFERDGKPIE